MAKYLSAKEFRNRLPVISEDLKRWGEIIILKRSKPVFKVVPFEEIPLDLLDRATTIQDPAQPDLQDIAGIIHKIREIS